MKFAAATLVFATLLAASFARPMFDEDDNMMPEDMMPPMMHPMMHPGMMGHFFPSMFDRFPFFQHPQHHEEDRPSMMSSILDELFGDGKWNMVDADDEQELETTELPSVEDVMEIIKNNGTDEQGKWDVINMETKDGGNQHVTLVSKDNKTLVDMVIMQHVFKASNETTNTTEETPIETKTTLTSEEQQPTVMSTTPETTTMTTVTATMKVAKRETEQTELMVDTNGSEFEVKKHDPTMTGAEN